MSQLMLVIDNFAFANTVGLHYVFTTIISSARLVMKKQTLGVFVALAVSACSSSKAPQAKLAVPPQSEAPVKLFVPSWREAPIKNMFAQVSDYQNRWATVHMKCKGEPASVTEHEIYLKIDDRNDYWSESRVLNAAEHEINATPCPGSSPDWAELTVAGYFKGASNESTFRIYRLDFWRDSTGPRLSLTLAVEEHPEYAASLR